MLTTTQHQDRALRPIGVGVPLERSKVRRAWGMIYWFRWGRHEFDIRVMRVLLELPRHHAADNYFQPGNAYFGRDQEALSEVVGELRAAMKARGIASFGALMKRHDAHLAKEARA